MLGAIAGDIIGSVYESNNERLLPMSSATKPGVAAFFAPFTYEDRVVIAP